MTKTRVHLPVLNDTTSDKIWKSLDRYPDMTDTERATFIVWLRAAGFSDIVSLLEKPVRPDPSDFVCPEMTTVIKTPCRLKSCRFNIDYAWSNNCVLNYMYNHGTQALTLSEISYLYGRPISEVQRVYNDALSSLRVDALVDEAESDVSLKKRFSFFKTKTLCCVCESSVESPIPTKLRLKSLGLAYCSTECKEEKPPRLVELESYYGLEISDILQWVFTHFKNLGLAEQALGIPRWLAYYACKQFLGYDLQEYFSSLKKIKETRAKKLVRRTWHKPSWVDKLIGSLEPTKKAIYAKYGYPRMNFTKVTSLSEVVLKDS